MPIIDDDEYEDLRRDAGRGRFLARAWARATGKRLADALFQLDELANGAAELGDDELDKMFARAPSPRPARTWGKNHS